MDVFEVGLISLFLTHPYTFATHSRGACHLCGSTEHKRKDCPKRDARQAAGGQSTAGVKRSHGGGARGGKSAHKNKVRRKET